MNYSISTYNEIPGAMNSTSHVVSVVDGRASAGGENGFGIHIIVIYWRATITELKRYLFLFISLQLKLSDK